MNDTGGIEGGRAGGTACGCVTGVWRGGLE
jgi:hypothetical protein